MRVAFILPGRDGGGGAHSVVQETIGLHRFGVETIIAIRARALEMLRSNYPELDQASVKLSGFDDDEDLARLVSDQNLTVATTFESLHFLKRALKKLKGNPIPTAYHIQDYEPFFCTPGTVEWSKARESYTAIPGQLLFAKTRWLCDIVSANHGQTVYKVCPSLDHRNYFPGHNKNQSVFTVCAMIRPKTPRRAPRRTARVLERIVSLLGEKVHVISFGASVEELSRNGIRLSNQIDLRGQLTREQVSGVLRESHVFLDLSDFQAVGRTGLEAMACGCVPILPNFGGTNEYAKNYINSVLIDTRDEDGVVSTLMSLFDLSSKTLQQMCNAAIHTSLDYSIEKSAHSEFTMFASFLNI